MRRAPKGTRRELNVIMRFSVADTEEAQPYGWEAGGESPARAPCTGGSLGASLEGQASPVVLQRFDPCRRRAREKRSRIAVIVVSHARRQSHDLRVGVANHEVYTSC